MNTQTEDKNFKLAIYLIKSTYLTFRKCLKTGISVDFFEFDEKIGAEGIIVVGKTKTNQPNWKDFLQDAVKERLPDLNNSSNRAVAFFKINKRIFIIPFGYGKHLIKDEAIEREFGLRTTLNIINADKLISVDKANIGDMSVQTKTQTSKKGTPDVFNIDILRDLLKGITGAPENLSVQEIGNVVTGNEGLYVAPKINIFKVPKLLSKIEKEYQKDTYKKRFDWIDNIKPEKDPTIIEILKNKLIKDLSAKKSENIHLAPPFIISWEDLEFIFFTPKGDEFYEFDLSNFYDAKSDIFDDLDWNKLLRQRIYLKNSNSSDSIGYSLWHFLNYQIEFKGSNYIFTQSNWYKVDKDYYNEIYKYCSEILESSTTFIDCEEKMNEGEYNIKLAKSNSDYILLDRKLVQSDMIRSQIEACDVFNSKNKEFIHVKFRESSSTLSHLFAQGRVASNSLRRDRTFRQNLKKKLGKYKTLITLDNKDLIPSDYTVTYAIIESKDRKFIDALPFFSLVNFRITAEEIMMMGFNLRVKKIQINKLL